MAAIVFDLDGTLIDSAPQIHDAANRVLAQEGLPALPLERVRSFIGNGVSVLVARLLEASDRPRAGAQHQRMVEAFSALYETAFDRTTVYPGVRAALAALAAEGHALAICTNKPGRATNAVLTHLGLQAPFAAVVAGDTLERKKPDPAPLLAAARALGQGPHLYVGDSEVDAQTAGAAGLPFLFFTGGYLRVPRDEIRVTAEFDAFEALPDLVARTLAGAPV